SSAQVQKLTNDLQAAVTKLQSFSAEPAKIAAEAQALGTSIQSLSADLAKATSAADQQQARLDELKKTYAELNAQLAELDAQLSTAQWGTAEFNELNRQAGALSQQTAALKRQIEEEAVATAKLRAEQQALADVQQKLVMLPIEETKAAANVERLTGSLNKLTGATKGADVAGARLTQTLSTGLVTAVRSGSIGS